jgi:hypothetical protein
MGHPTQRILKSRKTRMVAGHRRIIASTVIVMMGSEVSSAIQLV